jgi:hypothetical protein
MPEEILACREMPGRKPRLGASARRLGTASEVLFEWFA